MTPKFGFCFRPATDRSNGSGNLHLWVGNRSSTRTIPTPYDVEYREWSAVDGRLLVSESPDHRRPILNRYAESMERDIRLMERTIRELSCDSRECDIATIIDAFCDHRQKDDMRSAS